MRGARVDAAQRCVSTPSEILSRYQGPSPITIRLIPLMNSNKCDVPRGFWLQPPDGLLHCSAPVPGEFIFFFIAASVILGCIEVHDVQFSIGPQNPVSGQSSPRNPASQRGIVHSANAHNGAELETPGAG